MKAGNDFNVTPLYTMKKFVQVLTSIVYATDRSKAVVPVLFLFCVALWFIIRGDSCLVLPYSLPSCFFRLFSIVITSPRTGEEGAGPFASRACVC